MTSLDSDTAQKEEQKKPEVKDLKTGETTEDLSPLQVTLP